MIVLTMLIVNVILKNINSILRNMVWLIQSIFLTILTLLILFTPSMIYVYFGGSDPNIEFSCRVLGFIIWLTILLYIMRK